MTDPVRSTLRVERSAEVASVVLARPEVHEAFDDSMVAELTAVFGELAEDEAVRVVVLRSTGRSFCAGADLNWMRRMGEQSREQNEADALRLADMFEAIASCPKPVVARVQGAALGGGAGLVTAADLAVASDRAVLGFTEVRLGILPAVIAPFVLRKLGPGPAQALFLTGERLTAEDALRLGLVHRSVPDARLDEAVGEVVHALLCGSGEAQAASKRLVAAVAGLSPEQAREHAARAIALARASRDGREGLTAFLTKRKPSWHPDAGGRA
jgi:methylglutaconyl-CoA hydratase